MFRKLKRLESMIDVSVTDWLMAEHGWTFAPDSEGIVGDRLDGARYLYEVYVRADPGYTGRVTVPVLWDKRDRHDRQQRSSPRSSGCSIRPSTVSARRRATIIPRRSAPRSTPLNARIYDTVNNGVYKAGFATTQARL